jgi:hypothetical protein
MFQMHPLIYAIWHTSDFRKLPKVLSKISYQGVHVEGATLISPCLAFSSWYFSLILNHWSCICFDVLYVLFRELGIEFSYELNPISLCKGLVVILLIFFFAHIHKKIYVLLSPFSIKLFYITSFLYDILNDLGHLSD